MTKKRKKKIRIYILAFVGFILIFSMASIEYTSHSKFCATCHYMKPFYRSWKTSSHKDVECNVCHYPPGIRSKLRAKVEGILQVGRYWSKLYLKSKPWAEIPDESCLRHGCHDKRLLEGRVKFKKVVFDHKIHFTDLKRGKRLRCTSCHSQIVQGEHITVTETTCFICHFKKSEHYPQIAECSHCHHKEDLVSEKTSRFNHTLVFNNGFSCNKCHSHTIVGDGAIPKENCFKCHWETERLEKYDDTDLLHSMHITAHKIECNQCHMDIQHKIVKDIETIADCQACHTDSHKAQKILFTGEGGKGIPHAVPNIMLEKGLSCKGCHMFHEKSGGEVLKSDTLVSKAQACESCHGKGFRRIMKDWEISTEKKLKEIKGIFAKTKIELQQSQSSNREKAKKLLADAAFDIDIVERGKAVHNVEYSQELLSVSFKKVEQALQAINSSYKPQYYMTGSKVVPTLCSNCHTGIEEINTHVFGLTFPHKKHLVEQKIQCSTCHSNVRKHGEFIATKQSCSVCHHKNPKKDCTSCHEIQSSFFQGRELNGLSIPADMMADGGVGCSDCHVDARNHVVRPTAETCVNCHDESYKGIFEDWQKTTKQKLQSLKTLLAETKHSALTDAEKEQVAGLEKTLEEIELDGSSGVHNSMFIEDTLKTIQKKAESLRNIKAKK